MLIHGFIGEHYFCSSIDMEHRSNDIMHHVDALSRCHSVLVKANTFEQVLAIKQNQDEKITGIKKELERE